MATSLDEQVVIAVPAIVSKSIFDEVRIRMDENRRRQRERQIGTKYLLSGLLICGECGSAYCYYGGSKYQYIRCIRTDGHRYSAEALCTNTSVRSAELESFVWLDLCDLLADPQRIESEFARRTTTTSTNIDGSQEKQEQVVKNLQGRVSRLIDAYTQGLIEPSEFESRIGSLRAQLAREVAVLASLQGEHAATSDPKAVAAALVALAESVSQNLATASFELKRNLLKLLVQRVEICLEEIRIVYKVPPNPFFQSLDNRGNLQHWVSRQVVALKMAASAKRKRVLLYLSQPSRRASVVAKSRRAWSLAKLILNCGRPCSSRSMASLNLSDRASTVCWSGSALALPSKPPARDRAAESS